jgi:hypothetical protein
MASRRAFALAAAHAATQPNDDGPNPDPAAGVFFYSHGGRRESSAREIANKGDPGNLRGFA